MMNKEKIASIANRIASSVYSWYTIEEHKSYAFLNSHSLLCYYVSKKSSNSYRVVTFDSAKFASQEGRNSVNAILVALKMGSKSLLKAFGDYVKSDKEISAGKAVAPLLDKLGMTLPEFENLFNTETDFTKGNELSEKRYGRWRIVSEKNTVGTDKIIVLLSQVDAILGAFSSVLSYGIVEIKNTMPEGVLADYNPKNDSMRVRSDSSDGRLLHSFVHELAHRLWFRKLSKRQRDAIGKKYNKMVSMKDAKKHAFSEGDSVELTDGVSFAIYTVVSDYLVIRVMRGGKNLNDGEQAVIANDFTDDSIRRINGKLFDNGTDMFPSEYSRTSVEEFFAECFAYWRDGELCSSLSSFFNGIFH